MPYDSNSSSATFIGNNPFRGIFNIMMHRLICQKILWLSCLYDESPKSHYNIFRRQNTKMYVVVHNPKRTLSSGVCNVFFHRVSNLQQNWRGTTSAAKISSVWMIGLHNNLACIYYHRSNQQLLGSKPFSATTEYNKIQFSTLFGCKTTVMWPNMTR